MKSRKLVAALLLALLPTMFTVMAAGPGHPELGYSQLVFSYGPNWTQWVFGIAAAVGCASFTGPAAIGCAIAAVG